MKLKVFIVLTALAGIMVSCGDNKKSGEEATESPKYNIMKLAPVSREVNYAFPATLAGDKELSLFPQVEGRILKTHYKNGDYVKKGQTLITIDPTPYRLRVESDAANVKAAEAALSSAKLQYESQQRLYEKKIVSEYVMKTAQNSYLTAQAQVAQAKAALINSRTDLSHCTLVAPISGVVMSGNDNIGTLVAPGMPDAICTITDQSTILARFSITEDTYTAIFRENDFVGTSEGIKTKNGVAVKDMLGDIRLRTKDGQEYEHKGKLKTIGGIVDVNTGTVKCEVEFKNPNLVLHAGNSASVIFPDKFDNALVIPQTACKKMQDKYLVFKVDGSGQTVGVIVDVTPTDDGKEYIVHGKSLKAGDEIVADGVARIQEGQKVK